MADYKEVVRRGSANPASAWRQTKSGACRPTKTIFVGDALEPWVDQLSERGTESPPVEGETDPQLEVQEVEVGPHEGAPSEGGNEVPVMDETIDGEPEVQGHPGSLPEVEGKLGSPPEVTGETPPRRYPRRSHRVPLRFR